MLLKVWDISIMGFKQQNLYTVHCQAWGIPMLSNKNPKRMKYSKFKYFRVGSVCKENDFCVDSD